MEPNQDKSDSFQDKVSDAADAAQDQVNEAAEVAGEKAAEATEAASAAFENVKEKAEGMVGDVVDKAEAVKDKTIGTAGAAVSQAQAQRPPPALQTKPLMPLEPQRTKQATWLRTRKMLQRRPQALPPRRRLTLGARRPTWRAI